MRLPDDFVRTVTGAYGQRGARWLAALPDLLAGYAERWHLALGAPYELSYHYVVAATRADGQPAVLKLGPPAEPGGEPDSHEYAALRAAAGHGMVALLECDEAGGAALLERIEPGTRLTELVLDGRDEQATAILLEVMHGIRGADPSGYPFPDLHRWSASYRRPRPPAIPAEVFDRGAALFRDLVADRAPAVLLHADLHHDNVLRAADGRWLAIDPHGVVGEAAYEAAALLRNPYPRLLTLDDPARLVRHRVDQLAEGLAVPAERVRAWGYAQTVLSAVWDTEGDIDPGYDLACAELLR